MNSEIRLTRGSIEPPVDISAIISDNRPELSAFSRHLSAISHTHGTACPRDTRIILLILSKKEIFH
ncbi:MAG: hypothetical protein ACK2UH_07475, partial [Candidatus Promineifilaceae bacterium]